MTYFGTIKHRKAARRKNLVSNGGGFGISVSSTSALPATNGETTSGKMDQLSDEMLAREAFEPNPLTRTDSLDEAWATCMRDFDAGIGVTSNGGSRHSSPALLLDELPNSDLSSYLQPASMPNTFDTIVKMPTDPVLSAFDTTRDHMIVVETPPPSNPVSTGTALVPSPATPQSGQYNYDAFQHSDAAFTPSPETQPSVTYHHYQQEQLDSTAYTPDQLPCDSPVDPNTMTAREDPEAAGEIRRIKREIEDYTQQQGPQFHHNRPTSLRPPRPCTVDNPAIYLGTIIEDNAGTQLTPAGRPKAVVKVQPRRPRSVAIPSEIEVVDLEPPRRYKRKSEVETNTDQYKEKRKRNNEAVRKSRAISKMKQSEQQQTMEDQEVIIQALQNENGELKRENTELKRDNDHLRLQLGRR